MALFFVEAELAERVAPLSDGGFDLRGAKIAELKALVVRLKAS